MIGPEDLEKMQALSDLQDGKIRMRVQSMLDAMPNNDLRWYKLQETVTKTLDADGDGKISLKELCVGAIAGVRWLIANSYKVSFAIGWLLYILSNYGVI